MKLFKKKKMVATNEFNQTVEGTSLTKEAWKRLRKNKMAVVGMVIVIIYALLAIFADALPLYPYDEAITQHQNLRPSLTRSAGELMLEQRLKNIYFQAWRNGELAVSEEDDARIREWVQESRTNAVWDLVYKYGEEARANGTFEFSRSAQRQIDRMLEDIENDIQITVNHLYAYDADGERYEVANADYQTLLNLYSTLLNVEPSLVETTLRNEVRASVSNQVRANDETLEGEDLEAAIELEMDALGEEGYQERATQNLVGYIMQLARREAERDVSAQNSEGTITFPYKGSFELSSGMTAEIEASKMHERRYYLGTDYLGRDLLSRIIYGGQISIAIGLVGTIASFVIGILVGSLAGYLGGRVDYYLMRFVDIMYGLPYMLLVIICMAIFGRNILNLFLALALVSWLTIARMVRGQIMSLKNQEYVEAARSMGASTFHIILRHMIPNSLSVIIVYSTIRIPAFIMQESFLSFLGLGVQAPYASWGSLIGDAVSSMTLYPYKLIAPSVVMVVFLFAMNFFGDGLRDAFDPQSKNQL